ncbi:MAG: carboxylate-amine ligase [Nitrospira sp. SB0675_bin_23]|nr:carboxylate-amine ligase [Nitrospira sp. SB0667_bin_9]MYD31511.1 carboxylate-amine ligase [Nitrospira sp. SB0661_bin_20]MYH02482.1 carboxylate-amine ligase [Nitrospira sp. SB0675_bin_23]MYJ22266.1 carboxylate-amine ligase [Nitrospira sp. SB0673_bin_12]
MMTDNDLNVTLGVEEEFFLVDPESRDLIADPDPAIFETCERASGPHTVVREFLRSQIETNTRVCANFVELRNALTETRRLVIDAARHHKVAVIASSTHPFADWRIQLPTPKERYQRLAITLQERRSLLVGGMHIHVGFGNPESRIRVMTALRRYLPLLNALSASSPFSSGRETGFKSYRLNLLSVLPRFGLPPAFFTRREYENLLSTYQSLKFIDDGSELWWDLRPSPKYPTIELRICDICTRLNDALAVAAVYASLIRKLLRQNAAGALPPEPASEIIAENRWLAARYGVLAFFGNTALGGRIDINDCLTALVEDLTEDARALGCETELRHSLSIIKEGTGADLQIDHFRLRRLEGDSANEALRSVVDLVIRETMEVM